MWIRSSALFEEKPIWKGPHALWMWKEPRRVIQWERGTAPRSLHVGWKCCGQNSADVDDGWDWQLRLERFLHRVEDGIMSAFLVWLWPDTKQNRQVPSLQCSNVVWVQSYQSKKSNKTHCLRLVVKMLRRSSATNEHPVIISSHTRWWKQNISAASQRNNKHSQTTAVSGDV